MATMAFPSLPLPPLDDTMEVSSSPAGNTLDDDIEIDFDDYPYNGAAQLTDDEHMLEDGDPVRPTTATDEVMDDDEQVDAAPINEEVMQDSDEAGQVDLADEELIDYDDDDDFQCDGEAPVADTIFKAPETTVHDTAAVITATAATQSQAIEPADEEIIRQAEPELKPEEVLLEETTAFGPADTAEADSTASLATESALQPSQQQEAHMLRQDAAIHATGADGESNQELYTDGDESKVPEAVEDGKEDGAEPAAATIEEAEADSTETFSPKPPPQLPGTLDTTPRQVSEGPPTPTDTGLHPMTVRYGEHAMPLFKSRNQPDGLLKNDNLANVSLSDLIKSCRERLPVVIGEVVCDDQNLVLGFDSMGLVLVEGSNSASETSLEDVLDVYLLLHRNDGNDDVPPLSMTLTVQLKFTSHLQIFKRVASRGKGMSNFAVVSPQEDEDYYDDEAEQEESHEDDHATEQDLAGESEEQADVRDLIQDPSEGEHEQYEGTNEYTDEGDYSGQHEGQEYNEDTNYAEYDEHAEYPDPEEDVEGTADDRALAPEADQSRTPTHDAERESDAAAPNSATGSTAVRNGQTNDATDTFAEDGRDELASLTEEHDHEAEEHVLGYEADTDFDQAFAADNHDDGGEEPVTGEDAANDELGLNADRDDSYSADVAYPEPENNGEELYDEAGEELAQHEERNESHADQVDNGNAGELQPQEDDDQFHTALDLLDGEDPEHGPGNAAPYDQSAEHEQDNIVFDDDEEDASKGVPTEVAANNSPLGKRSFEEHADDDLFDFGDEEPDLKKPRSG